MFADGALFEQVVSFLPGKTSAIRCGIIRKGDDFSGAVLHNKILGAGTTSEAQRLLHAYLNSYDKTQLLALIVEIAATFTLEGRTYHYFSLDYRTGRDVLLYMLVNMLTYSGGDGLPAWIDETLADRIGVALDLNADGEIDDEEEDAGCSFREILDLINRGQFKRHVSLIEQTVEAREQVEDIEINDFERAQEIELDVLPGDEFPGSIERTPLNLFEHQKEAINQLNSWWSDVNKRGGILCLPTGGGKTKTASAFVHNLRRENPKLRVLWLAHRKELVDQAFAALVQTTPINDQLTIGRFEARNAKITRPCDIVVASIDTLKVIRKTGDDGATKTFPNLDQLLRTQRRWFDIVIVDECHHVPASGWMGMLKEIRRRAPGARFLGLSATPTRTNAAETRHLHALLGVIEYQVSVAELIRKRILARPVIRAINTSRKFSMTSKQIEHCNQFQEFSPELVDMVARDEARNKTISDLFKKNMSEFGQTLFFAANLEHASELRRLIGIETAFIVDGKTERLVRKQAIEAFSSRRVRALINVGVFTEGTDLPGVESVFLTAFTKSAIKFRQMVGRGLRGPRLGGTEECKIVAFQDLFEYNGSRFDAGFESGEDYLRALGLDPSELEEVSAFNGSSPLEDDDGTVDPPIVTDDDIEPDEETIDWVLQLAELRMKLQEATNFFRSLPLTEGNWEPPAHMPLKGFYWVPSAQGEILIPVFEDDESELRRRVMELWTYGKTTESSSLAKQLTWVAPALWDRFRAAAAVALVPPKFEEFVKLEPQQALDYATALLVRTDETGGLLARAAQLPQPAQVGNGHPIAALEAAVQQSIDRIRDRTLESRAGGFVLGDVSITAQEARALAEVWAAAPELGALGASAISLVARLCQRELTAGGIDDSERAHRLLAACVAAGGAPASSDGWIPANNGNQAPQLSDIKSELIGLSRSEGIELVKAAHSIWFSEVYRSHDELMYEILLGMN